MAKTHIEDIDYPGLSLCGLLGVPFENDEQNFYGEVYNDRMCISCYRAWDHWGRSKHHPEVIKKWRDGKKESQK
ncbi:MAG: hypothetical protein ACXABD_17205 [Candidatus Thorarchaeota archaeon]